MIPYEKGAEYPRVSVIVPSATLPRFLSFEISLEALFTPHFSDLFRIRSLSPAQSRNDAVRLSDPGIKAFWFIDDDHQFRQETLIRLLDHNVPFVVPIVSYSEPPFQPVIFKGDQVTTPLRHHDDLESLLTVMKNATPEQALSTLKSVIERGPKQRAIKQFIPYSWRDLDNAKGLYPVFAAGGSGLLVRREVFERVPQPWFQMGQFNPEMAGEDVFFSERVRNAGFPIYVDLDTTIGHNNITGATPTRLPNGQWTITLVYESGQQVQMGRKDSVDIPTDEQVKAATPPAPATGLPIIRID